MLFDSEVKRANQTLCLCRNNALSIQILSIQLRHIQADGATWCGVTNSQLTGLQQQVMHRQVETLFAFRPQLQLLQRHQTPLRAQAQQIFILHLYESPLLKVISLFFFVILFFCSCLFHMLTAQMLFQPRCFAGTNTTVADCVDQSDLIWGDVIGVGAFGTVYRCQWRNPVTNNALRDR